MKNELATTPAGLPLADMNIPQLTQAQAALGDAQQRYDRLSGICAVLRGLVLTEIKHKLPHGKFMNWVDDSFGKTHREATRCMRLAEDFTARIASKKTPEGKLDTRVHFEAQQLLLGDLAANLAAIEDAKLDMSNPVVSTVAAYVDGRSYRQMLLDLGSPRLGGDTRPVDPKTGERINHERKGLDERLEIARILAKDRLKAVVNGLAELLDNPATGYALLSKPDQEVLRGAFIDYGRRLKEVQ